MYDKAVVLSPLQPDDVRQGRPSDHAVAISRPNVDKGSRSGFLRKVTRSRRVLTASNVAMLGLFLLSFNWAALSQFYDVNQKLDVVNGVLYEAQEAFCPLVHYSVRVDKHSYAASKVTWLSKLKTKEFWKHGYSSPCCQM